MGMGQKPFSAEERMHPGSMVLGVPFWSFPSPSSVPTFFTPTHPCQLPSVILTHTKPNLKPQTSFPQIYPFHPL